MRSVGLFDVFVCHASGDKPTANAIVQALEARGLQCWIAPRNVVPGSDYAQAIVQGIGSSRLLLLVHTVEANTSPHVRREVERAASRDIPILPFRIADITLSPSLEYFISSAHWFDATDPPVAQHLDRLGDTLVERLGTTEQDDEADASGLSNVPRNQLAEFVTRFGPQIADDPRRVQALLRDTSGEYRTEIAVLTAAAEEGVGAALLSSTEGMTGSTASRLVQQLQRNRAIEQGAAEWAVVSWAQALGVAVELGQPPPPEVQAPEHEATRAVGGDVIAGDVEGTAPFGAVPPAPPSVEPPAPPPAQPDQRQTAQPPAPPPPPPPPPTQKGDDDKNRTGLIVGVVGIVAVIGAVVVAALALGGGDNGGGGPTTSLGASEVFLEPRESPGPDAFTTRVDALPAIFRRELLPQPEPSENVSLPGAVQSVSGGQVGLYGGTTDNSSCDGDQMVDFLTDNASKAAAWAGAQGIDVGDLVVRR